MRVLVTGAAGFVGSNLVTGAIAAGHDVLGIDSFTPYYDVRQKRSNVQRLVDPRFELVTGDLLTIDLPAVLADVDVVFHQAGQPGVRLSWSDGFEHYERLNIAATQRLLEAACAVGGLQRFVFASSSSVYGNAATYPTDECFLPRPHSPYGVTKLAAEHLCGLYGEVHGLPTVSLRYFTVYGPGQRPDMLMHRVLEAALSGQAVPLYGTGEQVREFTYVGDVVRANLAAAEADLAPGAVINIAGGSETTVKAVLDLVTELTGEPVAVDRQGSKPGDVERTGGAIERARDLLSWEPLVDLRAGVEAQLAWHRVGRAEGWLGG
jgi:UDP-glucuronate 4-epimerase